MTWWTLALGCGVLELDALGGIAAGLDLELLVWWGDGRARAVWISSQTGRVLRWAAVGSG
jgi:hypothetical protein